MFEVDDGSTETFSHYLPIGGSLLGSLGTAAAGVSAETSANKPFLCPLEGLEPFLRKALARIILTIMRTAQNDLQESILDQIKAAFTNAMTITSSAISGLVGLEGGTGGR